MSVKREFTEQELEEIVGAGIGQFIKANLTEDQKKKLAGAVGNAAASAARGAMNRALGSKKK